MQAAPQPLDLVIHQLDAIVNQSLRNPARIGYFTALYQRVTLNVKRAILAGNVFDDNARMERMDSIFANRFLDAWNTFSAGGLPMLSWKMAFDALPNGSPLVIQHLLLGMNAHINLDLGIAAASVAPGPSLPSLRQDFLTLIKILARLSNAVELELGEISPRLKKIERLASDVEDKLFDFAMDVARDEAWKLAQTLAMLPPEKWAPVIATRDRAVADLARGILSPGMLAERVVEWIAQAESRDISYNIQVVGE